MSPDAPGGISTPPARAFDLKNAGKLLKSKHFIEDRQMRGCGLFRSKAAVKIRA
jgi:hypothetical protein